MLQWAPIAGWMGFPYLSQSAGITHSFALGYRLTDNGQEPWTQRFNRFKANQIGALYGGARLLYAAVPRLIQTMGTDIRDCVFVPALSSSETVAAEKRAIPIIAKETARLVGARFELGALSKNPHGRIHNLYSAESRNAELDKAQYKSTNLGARQVFVFDDFITRGDTLSRIALAIHAANPQVNVYGIALAKTERIDFCPNPTNDQMSAEWNTIWEGGEQETKAAK